MTTEDVYDMSAGVVKIPLTALVRVVVSAVINAKDSMNRCQGEIDNAVYMEGDAYHKNHHAQFYGKQLVKYAQDYSEALQLYHALIEAGTRETLVIVR